jgi:hypothetical protein
VALRRLRASSHSFRIAAGRQLRLACQPGIGAVAGQVAEVDEVNPGHDLQALPGRELSGKGPPRSRCGLAERFGEVLGEEDGRSLALVKSAEVAGAEQGLQLMEIDAVLEREAGV